MGGRSEERGAAAVEFALVMLPMLFLLFGAIQYGFYFYAREAGTLATSDAVRRLSVGDCQSPTELKNLVANRLGAATSTPASALSTTLVYRNADGTPATAPGVVGGSVELTVGYRAVNMNFPFVPLPSGGDIETTVFGRVEDVAATTGGCA